MTEELTRSRRNVPRVDYSVESSTRGNCISSR